MWFWELISITIIQVLFFKQIQIIALIIMLIARISLLMFVCLMAYQLFLGYLMPKPFS